MQQRACGGLAVAAAANASVTRKTPGFFWARNACWPRVLPGSLGPGTSSLAAVSSGPQLSLRAAWPGPFCAHTDCGNLHTLGVCETRGACVSPSLSSGFLKGDLYPSAHTPLGH